MSDLLDVKDLTVSYGAAQVLFGVTLSLREGEVAALMGRNGAGKSTTLKAIMGLLPATGGAVRFMEQDVLGLEPYKVARLGLGYVPEERRIFTDLTVDENLAVGRRPPQPGREAWTPEKLFEIFPNLAEMRTRRASAMSGGEQQMLTIARTLMGNPRAVLLDEPSEGLAPVIVEEMAEAILAMKRAGTAVLLCEQNLHFAGDVSDRAFIIEKGVIRYADTMTALQGDEAAREAYLSV